VGGLELEQLALGCCQMVALEFRYRAVGEPEDLVVSEMELGVVGWWEELTEGGSQVHQHESWFWLEPEVADRLV
jgi:hypothetical protein